MYLYNKSCSTILVKNSKTHSINRKFFYAKNIDNIPDRCKRILSKGVDICWYIIGYGSDDMLTQKSKMQAHVFILGKKKNRLLIVGKEIILILKKSINCIRLWKIYEGS